MNVSALHCAVPVVPFRAFRILVGGTVPFRPVPDFSNHRLPGIPTQRVKRLILNVAMLSAGDSMSCMCMHIFVPSWILSTTKIYISDAIHFPSL